jgi:protein ImuB
MTAENLSTELTSRSEPLIVCVLVPKLELSVAAGGRTELLGIPAAVAPEVGAQTVGEVSEAAEGFGIHRGMRLGEALARCMELKLVPPDPAGVETRWEEMLQALEEIGAAIESLRPGLVCFDARGLLRIHGGTVSAVLAAARQALARSVRFGVAPTRFAALAAAARARPRRPLVISGGARETRQFLAPLSVTLFRDDPEFASLPDPLMQLGITTLGGLAQLPAAAVTDRFGTLGRAAWSSARGGGGGLRPREPRESVTETLELPEAGNGMQLERALGLLIDRLLARRERRGRTLRSVVISAALVAQGGTWSQRLNFREALSDPLRMRLALNPKLALLPAPAQTLTLGIESFGPAASDQKTLLEDPAKLRHDRLREAVRQARTVAGPDTALRVLQIDPASRFPERRVVLTPFER